MRLIKRWATGLLSTRWINILLIVASLSVVGVVAAQQCDPYLPCGPLPWSLPSMPDLQSPTPIPTLILTAVSTSIGGTPAPTQTPFVIPTYTPFVDTAPLESGVATINAMLAGTDIPIYDVNGTPVSMSPVEDLVDDSGTVFGYVKGISEISFGPLTPLVGFSFISLFAYLALNVSDYLAPFIFALIGLIRKIIQFILDLIPF